MSSLELGEDLYMLFGGVSQRTLGSLLCSAWSEAAGAAP